MSWPPSMERLSPITLQLAAGVASSSPESPSPDASAQIVQPVRPGPALPRVHAALRAAPPIFGFGDRNDAWYNTSVLLLEADDCVLVVIDAQPGFYAEPDPRAREVLARLRWLVILAGHLGVPVIVTEEDAPKNGATDQAVRDVLPAGSPVLDKPTFGLTGTPPILEAVKAPDRGTAVLVGFESDVCVAQSAVGLVDAGLRVVVVEDAVYSPGEMHARGLARAVSGGAELNHAKGVGYEWVRTVEASRRIIDADPRLNPAPFPL